MTTLTKSPPPWLQFLDANGNPYAGYLLHTYESGTSTPLATYGDSGATSLNLNPYILDAAGRADMYLLPQAYKFVLSAPDDPIPLSPIKTTDPVYPIPLLSADVDVIAVAGEGLGAEQVVAMSSGTGGRTAGRWYKADADEADLSIGALKIGMTTASIASGSSGTVRTEGAITGLGGLSAGTVYYVSSTAGSLTSSPPANAKIVGVAYNSGGLLLGEQRQNDVRRMTSFQTPVGNVGAGEDTLASYSAGAEGIYGDGMGWEFTFFGTTTNNANTKTLRLRLIEGANNTVLLSAALTTNEAGRWHLTGTVLRASSTTFSAGVSIVSGPANTAATFTDQNVTQAATATFANAIEIRLTGEATADNDVVMTAGLIKRVGIGR